MVKRELIDRLEFFIPTNRVAKNGRKQGMDGLNEIVRQSRGNVHLANKRKYENERHVAKYALEAMKEAGWVADERLCFVCLLYTSDAADE